MNIWLAIVLTLIAATARRLHQRLHGHDDEAAELHRHARDVLHPPGRQPRRDEGDHQPGRRSAASTRPPATTAPTRSSAAASGRRTTSASRCCGGSRSRSLATWVLARTRVGNWIFGVGGDANAARNVGVPVARVKIGAVHDDVVRVRADGHHDRAAAGLDAGRPGRRRGVPVHHRRGRRRLRADRRLRLGDRRRRSARRSSAWRSSGSSSRAGTPTGASCSSA